MSVEQQVITATNKSVRERLDDPYQLATQFGITNNEDGFFLSFGVADPSNIDPSTNEVPVHPVAKVFVGRHLMQNIVRVLLGDHAIQQLPALKKAREEADKELAALQKEARE